MMTIEERNRRGQRIALVMLLVFICGVACGAGAYWLSLHR